MESFDRCRVLLGVSDFIISKRNAIALRVAVAPAMARYSLTAYDFMSTRLGIHKNHLFH